MKELIIGDYEQAKSLLNSRLESYEDGEREVVWCNLDTLNSENLESEIALGENLFGVLSVFILRDLSQHALFEKVLDQSSESRNDFFFLEEKVLKKERGLYEKRGIRITELGASGEKKLSFNIFSLADAFGRRDKKELWLAYEEALSHARAEEIHGVLFWQLKNLALVKWDKGKGLKTFVLKKNLRYAQNFSDEDIKRLSRQFLKIFHERKNYSPLELELEKIILSL